MPHHLYLITTQHRQNPGAYGTANIRTKQHSTVDYVPAEQLVAAISNNKPAPITCHNSKEGLQDYAVIDEEDHKNITLIVSKKPQPGPPLTPA